MIMAHGDCSWNVFYDLFKCLGLLKGCLNATLQFPSHLPENIENTHIHTRLFFFEKSWTKFFLKQFVFAFQF